MRRLNTSAIPVVLLSTIATASAAAVRPLAIEDAVAARQFHTNGRLAAIAPDNQLIAYTVCDPRQVRVDADKRDADISSKNAAEYSMGCNIWLSPAQGGDAQNVTAGDGNNWGPSWSPDGHLLAFYSDRGGRPRVWLWDRASGRTRVAADVTTRTRYGFEAPQWTPDSQKLIVKLFPVGITQSQLDGVGTSAPTARGSVLGSTVTILRSGHTSSRGVASVSDESAPQVSNALLADLGLIDVSTGHVRRLVSRVRTVNCRLSPDGKRLFLLDDRGQAGGDSLHHHAMVLIELSTGRQRELVSDIQFGFSGAASWSPDGRWIVYATARVPAPRSDRQGTPGSGGTSAADLYVVPATGGEPKRLVGAPEGTFSTYFLPPLWSEESHYIYAVGAKKLWRGEVATGTLRQVSVNGDLEMRRVLAAADGSRAWSPDHGETIYVMTLNERTKQHGFYRLRPERGVVTRLIEADRHLDMVFGQPIVSQDGEHVVYVSQSASEPVDLWIAKQDFREERRLTTINPQLAQYRFGRSRLIEFTSDDGNPLCATILLPPDYVDGRRYPVVTWVYAGEMGSRASNTFGLVGVSAYNLQMLATRGYVLLWPDVPVKVGSPMQDVMKAVLPAINRVVELGIADSTRLAVMGQSNGGYSVLSLLVQTNRFKAAVMNAGFGNLSSFYGSMGEDGDGRWVSWLESGTGAMGGPPWQEPQRFVQNSPIFFLDRVETPLIMEAGSSDPGIVPYSDEVFVGLKRLDKDVTYLRYGGEGHVLAAYANLVDYWNRITTFYHERLMQNSPSGGAFDTQANR